MNASTNIAATFITSMETSTDKYLGKSCASWCCLKNLKPESPTQSEKIIHRKDKRAIEREYNPYCSGGRRLVYTGTIIAFPSMPQIFDGEYFSISLKIAVSCILSSSELATNSIINLLR